MLYRHIGGLMIFSVNYMYPLMLPDHPIPSVISTQGGSGAVLQFSGRHLRLVWKTYFVRHLAYFMALWAHYVR